MGLKYGFTVEGETPSVTITINTITYGVEGFVGSNLATRRFVYDNYAKLMKKEGRLADDTNWTASRKTIRSRSIVFLIAERYMVKCCSKPWTYEVI